MKKNQGLSKLRRLLIINGRSRCYFIPCFLSMMTSLSLPAYSQSHRMQSISSNSVDSTNQLLIRAGFAELIARQQPLLLPGTISPSCQDVAATHPNARAIQLMLSKNWQTCNADGDYDPDRLINREEALATIGQILGMTSMSTDQIDQILRKNLKDADQISPWAKPGIANAITRGILPKTSLTLRPKDLITTSEIKPLIKTAFDLCPLNSVNCYPSPLDFRKFIPLILVGVTGVGLLIKKAQPQIDPTPHVVPSFIVGEHQHQDSLRSYQTPIEIEIEPNEVLTFGDESCIYSITPKIEDLGNFILFSICLSSNGEFFLQPHAHQQEITVNGQQLLNQGIKLPSYRDIEIRWIRPNQSTDVFLMHPDYSRTTNT